MSCARKKKVLLPAFWACGDQIGEGNNSLAHRTGPNRKCLPNEKKEPWIKKMLGEKKNILCDCRKACKSNECVLKMQQPRSKKWPAARNLGSYLTDRSSRRGEPRTQPNGGGPTAQLIRPCQENGADRAPPGGSVSLRETSIVTCQQENTKRPVKLQKDARTRRASGERRDSLRKKSSPNTVAGPRPFGGRL